jgi:hypothetical protein
MMKIQIRLFQLGKRWCCKEKTPMAPQMPLLNFGQAVFIFLPCRANRAQKGLNRKSFPHQRFELTVE